MYVSVEHLRASMRKDPLMPAHRLSKPRARAKRNQFAIYDEHESEEEQETIAQKATENKTPMDARAGNVPGSDETALANSATHLEQPEPVMSFDAFVLQFDKDLFHPDLQPHLSRFPRINVPRLLIQTCALQSDYQILQRAFVEHSPIGMLQANAAAINEVEVRTGGLNIIPLWHDIYRFVPMMVGQNFDDARKESVMEKWDELKGTFEEYKDALIELKRLLEDTNRGLGGLRSYGGEAKYEII